MISIGYDFAYFLGSSTKGAENKGNSAMPKTFPQVYPQKPWKPFLLLSAFGRCSQERESMHLEWAEIR